jgi:hypothetical protein
MPKSGRVGCARSTSRRNLGGGCSEKVRSFVPAQGIPYENGMIGNGCDSMLLQLDVVGGRLKDTS